MGGSSGWLRKTGAEPTSRFVAIPIRDGGFMNPDLLGNLHLEESDVDPAGPDVIP
jgi:hypothetical protein